MRVIRFFSTRPEQPATSPFPLTNGVLYELRGGNVVEPMGVGTNWFSPPYPEKVLKFFLNPVVTVALVMAYWAAIAVVGSVFAGWSTWCLLALLPLLLVTLPFVPGQYIAVRFGRFGMYAGSKIFGVDSPAYREWMCDATEVYDGSQAMCFTIRFSQAIK